MQECIFQMQGDIKLGFHQVAREIFSVGITAAIIINDKSNLHMDKETTVFDWIGKEYT